MLRKIQEVRAALSEEDALQERLKQLAQVSLPQLRPPSPRTMSRLPERGVYLGELVSRSGDTPVFDMKSRIVYPMEGGTALMTFENEAVAQHVLRMKQHTVHLDKGYRIRVEAQPVQLVVPKQVEVDSVVSPRCVLVSDLPQMDPESLLDKLGFHFSRKVNGGGEVHSCQMMEDMWAAVVTFTEDDVVGPLVLKQLHPVRVQNSTHQVRVSPFICGQMGGLQVETQVCSRTVLLTGIPDVLDLESLQDYLTVHFQKESNGGGEVLQCAYHPPGGRTLAVFSDQSR
uniref:Interferon-induced protein 35 n=1 Tax=Tetraodon nigroviridis TaxID=99883 RepID=H3CE04_TETNG